VTASGDKCAGLGVGEIAYFVDGFPDALCQLRIYGGNAIDRTGNGGDGNARPTGYIADADGAGAFVVR
jgi:hypothetical protein